MKAFIVLALCAVSAYAGIAEDLWLEKNRILPEGLKDFVAPEYEGRIVGGHEVSIAQFPYQLSLRSNGNHICGASVISANWALSAAHCTFPMPNVNAITFRGGSASRLTGGVIFQAAQIINHPQYNNNNLHNDVCVIRITTSFVGANIAPITLVPSGTGFAAGTRSIVSGWGLMQQGGTLPVNLRAVDIPVVAQATCNNQWGGIIHASMVCAGEPGRDSCNGDSGGPLVTGGRQFGIVSWGATACGGPLPGVYANIGNAGVRSFISQHTGVSFLYTPVCWEMKLRTPAFPMLAYTPGSGPPQAVAPQDTIPNWRPPVTNGPPLSPLQESRPGSPAQTILYLTEKKDIGLVLLLNHLSISVDLRGMDDSTPLVVAGSLSNDWNINGTYDTAGSGSESGSRWHQSDGRNVSSNERSGDTDHANVVVQVVVVVLGMVDDLSSLEDDSSSQTASASSTESDLEGQVAYVPQNTYSIDIGHWEGAVSSRQSPVSRNDRSTADVVSIRAQRQLIRELSNAHFMSTDNASLVFRGHEILQTLRKDSKMKVFALVALCFVAVSAGPDEDLWLQFNRRMPGAYHTMTEPLPEKPFVGRIVGGIDADIANYPYQLSLRRNGGHSCGASVISGHWALSAAHCTYPLPNVGIMSLRGGSSNRLEGGHIFNVAEIINHPQYDDWNLENDVCVIRTTENMLGHNHPHIHPIQLDTVGNSHNPGSRAVLSGWGLNAQNVLPVILKRVDIPKIDFVDCMAGWPSGWVTPDMICASEPGRDACNGDSGGPLVVGGRQIGIVSWGSTNCLGYQPGVFARVAFPLIRNFIHEETGV
ncbi:uncharacterized protein LOC129753280 [Uranotaenia lowii]|uniref:uncharacterized protein LOC129753280 n=1 Tax=Uranotaenia lowii TaxID=190385 RepID=UPI002478F947|nr:uncharacterized protein LOC129753280 [Uranotaenia lowii]